MLIGEANTIFSGAGRRCCALADGVVAGGVPIGTDAFSLGVMQEKLGSHERAHQQLRRLGDGFCQIAYLLLRFCLNARFGYWTRTVPPRVLMHVAVPIAAGPPPPPPPLAYHDTRVRATLAAILDGRSGLAAGPPGTLPLDALPQRAYEQAALPCKDGGLGLMPAAVACHAAYLASCCLALKHMREHNADNLTSPSAAADDDTPTLRELRDVHSAWTRQGGRAKDLTLSSLLSDTPSQHKLSEGVYERFFLFF